ncbi:unnamed protein product [Bursaphelenchus xylophilus]|uniref:(pine wood nematode) hypothetical protein n=1 Tax=Bursaphelenchus xylophilus TaxID=6326 RepID=A0A1I7RZG8_BURXY|nr:unnamed protein product [Bursaphelenchus xylophilus]CAG9106406.1 unnamed protein product [Bursaphelenchus xylophilus]
MKSYIPFVLNFTIPDLLLALELGIFVHPDPIFPFPGAYVRGLFRHFGSFGGKFSMALMFNTVAFAISAQCYCIMYRYAMLMDDLRIFHGMLRPTTWIFVYIGKFTFAGVNTYVLYKMTLEGDAATDDMISLYPRLASSYEGLNIPDISNSVLIYMQESVDVFTLSALAVVFIGFFTAEFVSVGCIYHILKKLEEKRRNFTERTYRLHRQLTTVLAFQLATPVLFIMCPITISLVCQILNSGFNASLGQYAILSLDLYGAANSFITIYFVKPYRVYVLRKVSKLITFISCGLYTKDMIDVNLEATSRSYNQPRKRANSVNPASFKAEMAFKPRTSIQCPYVY